MALAIVATFILLIGTVALAISVNAGLSVTLWNLVTALGIIATLYEFGDKHHWPIIRETNRQMDALLQAAADIEWKKRLRQGALGFGILVSAVGIGGGVYAAYTGIQDFLKNRDILNVANVAVPPTQIAPLPEPPKMVLPTLSEVQTNPAFRPYTDPNFIAPYPPRRPDGHKRYENRTQNLGPSSDLPTQVQRKETAAWDDKDAVNTHSREIMDQHYQ